jgi:hypothetical protein
MSILFMGDSKQPVDVGYIANVSQIFTVSIFKEKNLWQ